MKLTIKINMDNAAFEDNGEDIEVARILQDLAKRYTDTGQIDDERLQDINGNNIGTAKITK